MTDVLKIALERREHLQAEIERLDDFIRMAEHLIRAARPMPRAVPGERETPGTAGVNLRQGNTAVG